MNDEGGSSWMNTWTGGDEEEKESEVPGLRGAIGDWSSFMIAMDDEDGQELHRSLSSMNFKINKNNGATNNNNKTSSSPPAKGPNGMAPPPSVLSPLKRSNGMPPPTSGTSPTSSPSSSLKSSLGVPNPNNNSSRPVIGTSKLQKQQTSSTSTHHHHQYSKGSISSLSASIHYDSFGSGNTSPNSGSPISGSPITPPISASSSPNIIPKVSLSSHVAATNNSPQSGNMSGSPQLSSSKESEPSFLTNLFSRRKKEKSFQSSTGSNNGGNMVNSHGSVNSISSVSTSGNHHGGGININISDGNSSISSNTQFLYGDDDELSTTPGGLDMSMTSDKIHEGWIEMYINKKWKKKWCVLRGIHLEYYKGWWEEQNGANNNSGSNNNHDNEEFGKILLNYWYSFSKPSLVDGKFHFHILQSSDVEKTTGVSKNSKLKFRTEEEHISKRWIDECEKVIKKRKETTVTLRPLAEHKGGRGRSNTTVTNISFDTVINSSGGFSNSNGSNGGSNGGTGVSGSYNIGGSIPEFKIPKVLIPNELVDCLEADEKILLEKVKLLLEEFPPRPLPPDETPSSYRAKPRSSDGYYRVLSLDGGGLRSVMVCILIERIAKRYPKFLEHVDVFTGTSAGSIVAAGLAFEFPPKGTRRVLELTALPVFGKKRPGLNMGNAKYFARVLRASCYVFFQDRRFYEAQRKLVVPAFQLDSAWPPEASNIAPEVRRWQPRVFHNLGNKIKPTDNYLETDVIGDVLLRSASAPTYFPSHQGYIDGGVFANNPSLSAITLAMSPNLESVPADKIICLSIGTGLSSHFMEGGQDYDWGLLNWAPKLGNLLMGSQVDYQTQLCENMLGSRFHRLNPELGENTSMDDPKLVTELATLANTIDLTKTFEFIEKYFILPEDDITSPISPRPSNNNTSNNNNNNSTVGSSSSSSSYNNRTNVSTGSNGTDSPRNVSPRTTNGGTDSPRNVSPRNISPRTTNVVPPLRNLSSSINLDEDTSIVLTPR